MIVWTKRMDFGRRGRVEVKNCHCDRCSEYRKCIQVDNSEGEYGKIALCRNCIVKLIEKADAAEKFAVS